MLNRSPIRAEVVQLIIDRIVHIKRIQIALSPSDFHLDEDEDEAGSYESEKRFQPVRRKTPERLLEVINQLQVDLVILYLTANYGLVQTN